MSSTLAQTDDDITAARTRRECDEAEWGLLASRIAHGRHVLSLMTGESDDAVLIEQLALYCHDVEAYARAKDEVLSVALDVMHQQHVMNVRLREQLHELRRARQASS